MRCHLYSPSAMRMDINISEEEWYSWGGRRYKTPPTTIATLRQYTLNLCLSAYNIDSIYILFYHFLGAAAAAVAATAATCVLYFTLLCSSIYTFTERT